MDKDGDIEVDELNLILKALEKDGIRVSDLSYEKVTQTQLEWQIE